MKKRRFTREFKISVIRELENGKSSAQAYWEHSIHPSMLSKWKQEYKGNPEIREFNTSLMEVLNPIIPF